MEIVKLERSNTKSVANLMARIKPEFWSFDDAINQLSNGIGWVLMTNTGEPKGWLLCQWYEEYKTGEIECLGYDDTGQFKVGSELQPLVEECEHWIWDQGGVNSRFVIGSRGLSCHGKVLGKPWQELRELRVIDREEYEWLEMMGYIPSGILPDIYGTGNHGIMLLKQITGAILGEDRV